MYASQAPKPVSKVGTVVPMIVGLIVALVVVVMIGLVLQGLFAEAAEMFDRVPEVPVP